MKEKYRQKENDCHVLKNEMADMKRKVGETLVKGEAMTRSAFDLKRFVSISEQYRKKFSEELREALC
jgi:hypothetical protein